FHLYLIDVGSKSRTKLNNHVIKINEKYKIENNDVIILGVSKRTYKINIHIDKVLSYLDNKKNEAQKKLKVINEEIEHPLKNKNLLKLKVSNIYYKCNENDILDFFKDCGEIKNMHMYNVPIINKEEGVENGNNNKDDFNKSKKKKFLKQAIIEVYDKNTSANIIKKNDSFLYGRKIHIEYQTLHQHKYRDNNFNTKKKFENFDIQVTCKNSKYDGEKIIIKGENSRYKKFKRNEPGEYQRGEESKNGRRGYEERKMERRGHVNRRSEEREISRSKRNQRRGGRNGSSSSERSDSSRGERNRRGRIDRSSSSSSERSDSSRGERNRRGRIDRSSSSRSERSDSSSSKRSSSSRRERSDSSSSKRSSSSRRERSDSSSSKRSSSSRSEKGRRSRDAKKRPNKYSSRYSIES
ncbi:conserved Plasmodium protein, unknown function, partial [Plasmodium ovale curtisi]